MLIYLLDLRESMNSLRKSQIQRSTIIILREGHYDISMVLDSEGYPHIAYIDSANVQVRYAYFDGTDWQIIAFSFYNRWRALKKFRTF